MAKRIMRRFKLSEVSAVDKPAQEHARMVIMKRQGDADAALKASVASIIGDPTLSKADRAAMLDETTEQYLDYVGVPSIKQTKGSQPEKETTTMDTTAYADVLDVIKSHRNGVCIFAKQEMDAGSERMLTEAEATQAVTEHFKIYNRGNPDQAFAKGIANAPEGGMLLKWIQSCKIAGWNAAKAESWRDPQLTSSPRFTAPPRQTSDYSVNNPNSALDQLNELAAEVRRQHPFLTPAQAFARVYQDRANADLAAAERGENRPGGVSVRERVTPPGAAPSGSSPGRLGHSPARSSPGRP